MRKIQFLLAAFAVTLASCGSGQPNNVTYVQQPQAQQQVVQQPANVQVSAPDIPGFNVQQFNALLSKTSDPNSILAAINSDGNSINNLDLDGDGVIDYLKVDQVSGNVLQVVDEIGQDASQRIVLATLTINPQNNSYVIQGDPQYCGANYMYTSRPGINLGDMLFLHWMLTPRRTYYHPTWGYHTGYYTGYRSYKTHYKSSYTPAYAKTKTTTTTRTIVKTPATTTTTKVVSTQNNVPPSKVVAPPIQQRTSIADPTKSQRKFEVNTNNTGGKVATGFGKTQTVQQPVQQQQTRTYGAPKSSFGAAAKTVTPPPAPKPAYTPPPAPKPASNYSGSSNSSNSSRSYGTTKSTSSFGGGSKSTSSTGLGGGSKSTSSTGFGKKK